MGKLLRAIERRRPLIQVALDFIRLEDALQFIAKVRDLDVDIYEVGTPLVKSEGVRAVSLIKSLTNSLVLADTKTADTGALEVEMAYRAGADAVTVLASADDETIKSALKRASELGIDVVVDTVGSKDCASSISRSASLGAKIVNIHVGIDAQRRGLTVLDILRSLSILLKGLKGIYISASGGIRPQDVLTLRELGVSVIVMGSAITKASNPRAVLVTVLRRVRSNPL